jgi:peroxiredoxin Q/BCP
VADTDETWCRAFDVIHEKVLYGRRYLGVVRSTFLIGPDGRLLREWRNVKVPGHVAAVIEAIATLE